MYRFFALTIFGFLAVPGFAITVIPTAGCVSQVNGVDSTINFDGFTAIDPAGHATYSGNVLFDGGTNPGCGADWLFQDNSTTIITFDAPIDYFGFVWNSPDTFNSVQLFNGATQVGPTYIGAASFVTDTYMNFFADSGEQFTSVVLSSPGCCFETDNNSYRLVTTAASIPEPGTFLPTGLMAAVLLSALFRRRRA